MVKRKYIVLLLFLLSQVIFMIDNIFLLFTLVIINIIIIIKTKVLTKGTIKLVIFLMTTNMIFGDIKVAFYTSLKVLLSVNILTFIRIKYLNILHHLKVNNDLCLIVIIALTLLKTISKDNEEVKIALKTKGISLNIRTMSIFMKVYLNVLITKYKHINKTLSIKGIE